MANQPSPSSSQDSLLNKLIKPFRRQPAKPKLLTLPNKLLLLIFSDLDLVDQACLALTCKSFHFIFNSVFENEAFRFPRLYQLRLPFPSPSQYENRPRSRKANGEDVIFNRKSALRQTRDHLLHRLQTKRHKYCPKCLTLHRSDAFVQPTSHGPTVYRPYCCLEAGVVDLCPFLVLHLRIERGYLIHCAA